MQHPSQKHQPPRIHLRRPLQVSRVVGIAADVVRIQGFVGEEKLGKAYSYFALVPKEDYQGGVVDEVVDGFFNGS